PPLLALAVPTQSPGVVPGPEHLSVGLRGMVQTRLSFHDVELPAYCLLGRGDGRAVALDSMNLTRLGVAANALGAMRRVLQVAHRFATRRHLSGVALINRDAVRHGLAIVLAHT